MSASNDIWVEYILKYSHKDGTMKKWCEMMRNDGNMIEKCQQMMQSYKLKKKWCKLIEEECVHINYDLIQSTSMLLKVA